MFFLSDPKPPAPTDTADAAADPGIDIDRLVWDPEYRRQVEALLTQAQKLLP